MIQEKIDRLWREYSALTEQHLKPTPKGKEIWELWMECNDRYFLYTEILETKIEALSAEVDELTLENRRQAETIRDLERERRLERMMRGEKTK